MADEHIVEHLERLLEQAKSGEITGFAYAVVFETAAQATFWRGRTWESVAAAVGTLHHRVFSSDGN